MTYTALAIVFMLICVGLGTRAGRWAGTMRLAAGLAGAMAMAQFYFLTVR